MNANNKYGMELWGQKQQVGDDLVQFEGSRDARRLTYRLRQELANLAVVFVRDYAGSESRCCRREAIRLTTCRR